MDRKRLTEVISGFSGAKTDYARCAFSAALEAEEGRARVIEGKALGLLGVTGGIATFVLGYAPGVAAALRSLSGFRRCAVQGLYGVLLFQLCETCVRLTRAAGVAYNARPDPNGVFEKPSDDLDSLIREETVDLVVALGRNCKVNNQRAGHLRCAIGAFVRSVLNTLLLVAVLVLASG